MKLTRLVISGSNLRGLIDLLDEEVAAGYSYASKDVCIYILEEYRIMINADVSSTIVLDFSEKDKCQIDIVSSGSGGKFSADDQQNKDLVKLLKDKCKKKSWEILEEIDN